MNTKHTPTPWGTKAEGIIGWTIQSRETLHQIARVNPTYHYENEPDNIDELNAEFIVRAVNSHEELLEAAKFALDFANELAHYPGAKERTRNQLKEAIAKAEGTR